MIIKFAGERVDDIDLVIFDRDGTLIDLYEYWSWMVNKRAELLVKRFSLGEGDKIGLMFAMGVDLMERKLRREGPVGIKKREVVVQVANQYLKDRGVESGEDGCERIFKTVDALSLEYLPDIIKLIPGALQLLKQIKKSGGKLAIATTDRVERAKLTIQHLGLSDTFDCVVGADSVLRSKPAPDMVELILTSLKVDPNQAIIVGDAITDIEMGLQSGLKVAIGVCSGITEKTQLLEKTPYVVSSVAEIKVERTNANGGR